MVKDIIARGDQVKWMTSPVGFYLTRGFTLTIQLAPCMMWHQIKKPGLLIVQRESDANWVGTLSGTEGDMLKESLEDVKSKVYSWSDYNCSQYFSECYSV